MNRELLESVLAAREAGDAVVIVTGLRHGRQFAVTPTGFLGEADGVDPTVRDAARAALDSDTAQSVESDGERFLLAPIVALPELVVVGAVHIAQALIPMAIGAGYDVYLIDPRTAFATAERFPLVHVDNRWPDEAMAGLDLDARSAVVTLSHDPKIDEPALCAAMDSDAFYIGALGSKRNHAKRKERLAERGYTEAQIARIHGPIGLPLGGRSPAEIAVATLAEIVQARYRET